MRLAPVVAAACVLVLAATGCGSGDSPDEDAPAQDQATQGISGGISKNPTGPSPKAYGSFQLPSGNIACIMDKPAYTRCDVQVKSFRPPAKPAGCQLDYGSAVALQGRKKGAFICHGDTVLNPSAPVLGYGQSSAVGTVVCESSKAGVTCQNSRTGHGFFLAREKFRLF